MTLHNFTPTSKKKLAAIIVSNCFAKNNRLKYVLELQKYTRVDIYGECGLKCPVDENGQDLCPSFIKREYKFYLAFEKANCRDYITEKFFNNAFLNDAVPVVLGAHPDDYKAAAPNHSYIHVEDFASPMQLAEYLIKLDHNDVLYREYFTWKRKGQFIATWHHYFCRVCGMLFYSDFIPPPSWKPESTFATVNKCLPLNKWYWNRDG